MAKQKSMIKNTLLIEKLNKALELEYAATVQYVQHATTVTGSQYDAIAKELVVHANEELAHAVQVADLINDLGGTPSIKVEKVFTSHDSKKMLEQDLAGEQIAIDSYKELIALANELQEYGISHVLKSILANEEEHKRDLIGSLGR